MSTLPDRPNTALVVIDAQRGVVDHAHRRDAVHCQHRDPGGSRALRRCPGRLGPTFRRPAGPRLPSLGSRPGVEPAGR